MTHDDVLFGIACSCSTSRHAPRSRTRVGRSGCRLHGTRGPVWQITAIDTYSSFAWADLVVCPPSGPTTAPVSDAVRLRAAPDGA